MADTGKASACERLFAITELSEAIFLELDFTTVLTKISRTCRQWQAIVQGSRPLQEMLFQKPVSDIILRPCFEAARFSGPFVFVMTPQGPNAKFVLKHPMFDILRAGLTDHKYKIHTRPEPSWRRQFATQPPTDRVERLVQTPYGKRVQGIILNGTPLTLQDLEINFNSGELRELRPVNSSWEFLPKWRNKECADWKSLTSYRDIELLKKMLAEMKRRLQTA